MPVVKMNLKYKKSLVLIETAGTSGKIFAIYM